MMKSMLVLRSWASSTMTVPICAETSLAAAS